MANTFADFASWPQARRGASSERMMLFFQFAGFMARPQPIAGEEAATRPEEGRIVRAHDGDLAMARFNGAQGRTQSVLARYGVIDDRLSTHHLAANPPDSAGQAQSERPASRP